jgi:hypothetical protein
VVHQQIFISFEFHRVRSVVYLNVNAWFIANEQFGLHVCAPKLAGMAVTFLTRFVEVLG